jgi:hypothetical protein
VDVQAGHLSSVVGKMVDSIHCVLMHPASHRVAVPAVSVFVVVVAAFDRMDHLAGDQTSFGYLSKT